MHLTCNKHLTQFRVARALLYRRGKVLSARGAQQQQTAEKGDRGKGCEGTGRAAHETTIAGFAALRNGSRADENALRPAGTEAGNQPRRRLSASQPDQT